MIAEDIHMKVLVVVNGAGLRAVEVDREGSRDQDPPPPGGAREGDIDREEPETESHVDRDVHQAVHQTVQRPAEIAVSFG